MKNLSKYAIIESEIQSWYFRFFLWRTTINKPSDIFDSLDKSAEWINFFIDINNQGIVQEINWLIANYNNINELRMYFLRFINPNNFDYYMQCVSQLNAVSDGDIQNATELRVNVLYSHLKYNEQQKIDNKPLKMIAEELKKHHQ